MINENDIHVYGLDDVDEDAEDDEMLQQDIVQVYPVLKVVLRTFYCTEMCKKSKLTTFSCNKANCASTYAILKAVTRRKTL